MACSLERDASGRYDFTAQNHATPIVKVTATGNARLTAARFNHTDLPIQNGDTVSFTVNAGVNILKLVVAVANPNDTIKILEDCGDGQTQVLDQYQNDPADPVTGYSIFGF